MTNQAFEPLRSLLPELNYRFSVSIMMTCQDDIVEDGDAKDGDHATMR